MLPLSLLGASSAVAAPVTIGQAVDGTASECDPNVEWLQATSPPGFSYAAPGAGTITSWSTQVTTPPAEQRLTMKMYRKVGEPSTYQAVGHAGPETITAAGTGLRTFPSNVAVKAGDVLGFHTITDDSNCAALNPLATFAFFDGDLADGASGPFQTVPGVQINIQATFVYDNTFDKPKIKRNKKKGTATVTLNLPNPGTLNASGGGAKVSAVKSVPAGRLKLKVKARGRKQRQLSENGKVTVKPTITYTPTGGDPGTSKLKVKLLKR